MKIKPLVALALLSFLAAELHAATMLGPGGVTESFSVQPLAPPAGGWSTGQIAGAANQLVTPALLDAAVQNIMASSVNMQLPTDSASTPGTHGFARWNSNSNNLFVQMRPSGPAATLLMATLQNDTGGGLVGLSVGYDFGRPVAGTDTAAVPGWFAYYSLTGNAGDWVLIPEFTTDAPGPLMAELDLGLWAPGDLLHLLWVDENASGTDAAYTLDNFFALGIAPVPEPASLAIWAVLGLAASVFGAAMSRRRAAKLQGQR